MKLRVACIVASLFLLAVATATAQNAVVNYGSAEQTIRGFGGATAWLGQLTEPQATALFSPTSGLGLSVLRVRIDPTGSPTSTPPWATIAPNTGSWLDEVTNAQEAVAANPKAIVMATPWTPPASLKSSSSSQPFFSGTCSPAAGFCGGFLEPANYATYASYLEDFVTYFDNTAGFDLYAISMQNEPDFANVDYESCNWTAAQMDTWIAGNASTLTTKLIMPESFQFIQAQSNTALEDPVAELLISIIGGHLYGSSPTAYTLAQQDGKELWMTEHMFTPAGSQPAIGDALQLAEEIHNSMVTGNYSAYVYWWIWDDPADSINYGLINSSTTAPVPTYYGDAIGQFSKFIQPGYVMVSASDPIPGVFDSAYMGDGNLVIVAINSNTTAASFPVTIQGQATASFTPYQTSATETMAQLTPVSVTGGSFTYSLPAQSITTFVAAASTTPGFTLSPSASSVSVTQGKSATDTISVADLNGFTGSVSLAVSGVPAGVTAALGTNPTTGSSVLTFTASSTAATGAATVTVTGTSGSLTETATIALFVGSSSCNIVYTISPQSSSAFGGSITIDNTSTTALSSWTLGWTFANGQTVSQLWNGVETQTGANVTVTNESYNGSIPAGGSMSQVGFNGTWNGVTNAIPSAFTLNGTTCSSNGPVPTGSFTLAPSASTLAVTQGSSATDTIAVTDVNGFTGSVTLAASGLPSGVTAVFGTSPTTGTSVLTLTASSAATPGTSAITITGTSGSLTATTTIALTVNTAGSFTLTPSVSTLTIAQGSSTTDTITVTDVGGFNGNVTLAASGLPSGVTATFGTNPATGSSVLTLTASSTIGCSAGASTITITGTSGFLTATTTIELAITAPASFTLVPSATALSIAQGTSGTDTISFDGACGFTGSLTLAASGLPSGVTATFGTNPTNSTSVLTLTASATATVGAATVTITGTSGAVTASTTIALTVSPASMFTIAPSASALAVTQGSSGTDTISVTDLSGFTGSVTLAASGLPTGVTATFGTNPATGTSILTLAASSTATTGAATVTITGTSGSLTASATIALTVNPSTPTPTCTIDYTISSQWQGGFGAAITINNTGTTALTSWTLTWTFANGQTITQLWNGTETQSGANVTVTNLSYNGSIPAGGSYSEMGFNGTWNSVTNAIPTAFSLNGTGCTVN
ncbi:MAG: cellulose binding domain-containing protein [Terracidiphilus sp.]|jgi:O-glycosyl hydrolase